MSVSRSIDFGQQLRWFRRAHGFSLRGFADYSHHSKTVVWEWETGAKVPPPEVAAALDDLLNARGVLTTLASSNAPGPHDTVQQESERLAAQFCAARPGELVTAADQVTAKLAVDYLSAPGAALIDNLTSARRLAMGALRSRRLREHHQIRYLTADVGYLSGILAYAALDDGHPSAALTHTDAAWEAARTADNHQLLAWVRGTQSLILRFTQRYTEALAQAEDGLNYATSGTARSRLLAGIGQCHANMGNAAAAREALSAAELAMDEVRGADELPGLFTFSRAKLLYYSGSSLIWLAGGQDARTARDQAHTAIELWAKVGRDRSVADEALAHVYAATASLQLRDLEAAVLDLEPILSMPAENRVSWIAKRMDRIVAMLSTRPYSTDPLAAELLERIAEYS